MTMRRKTIQLAKVLNPAPTQERPFSKKIGFGHVINVDEFPVFTFDFTDSGFHLRTLRWNTKTPFLTGRGRKFERIAEEFKRRAEDCGIHRIAELMITNLYPVNLQTKYERGMEFMEDLPHFWYDPEGAESAIRMIFPHRMVSGNPFRNEYESLTWPVAFIQEPTLFSIALLRKLGFEAYFALAICGSDLESDMDKESRIAIVNGKQVSVFALDGVNSPMGAIEIMNDLMAELYCRGMVAQDKLYRLQTQPKLDAADRRRIRRLEEVLENTERAIKGSGEDI
jgi:hypothetical protein